MGRSVIAQFAVCVDFSWPNMLYASGGDYPGRHLATRLYVGLPWVLVDRTLGNGMA